jgi:DNA-binding GntR family transcriptional regulator
MPIKARVPRPAAPTQAQPRYLLVAQALVRQIERGVLKVGDRLATEQEIGEKFGISRHTAREALRQLSDAGLVERRPGVGTLITALNTRVRYTASISDIGELIAYNRQTRLEILAEDEVRIDQELATQLPDAAGQRWYRVRALRHLLAGAGEPVAHVEVLVHPAYEAIGDRIREPGVSFYQLLEDLSGQRIATLRQQTSSIAMPRPIGRLLHARAGSPALRVMRTYLGPREAAISMSINTYPHERFKVTTNWSLGWKPGEDSRSERPGPRSSRAAKHGLE